MSSATLSAIILNLFGFVISLLSTLFTISLCVLIALHRRDRQNLDSLLCFNTHFASFLFSLSFFLLTIETIKADFDLSYDDDSIRCRLRGYFLCVSASSNYNGYCLQAASRLIRVVYSQQHRIHTIKVYALAIICSWVFAVLLTLPYIIVPSFISFIASENYCVIPYTDLTAMIYSIIPVYGIQLVFVIFTYLRLVFLLHFTLVQNAQRELTAVKQILYIILTMGGMCMPVAVLWIVYLCTNYLCPITYRIQVLSYSIGTLLMNIEMIFINPRLRALVFCRRQRINPQHSLVVAYVLDRANITD
jgi:hypothetical protein